MLLKKQLLSQQNLNAAYVSLTTSGTQSIASNLTVAGGVVTLKNSEISDSANVGYLRISPQNNRVIIYDAVDNQQFDVFSKNGAESTYITTINQVNNTSYGLIDVSNVTSMAQLNINTVSGKPVAFGLGRIIFGGNDAGVGGNTPKISIGASGSTAGSTENTFILLTRNSISSSLLGIDSSGAGGTKANNWLIMSSEAGMGGIDFRTNGSFVSGLQGGNSRLRIKDNGSIGINASSPSYKLHVFGDGTGVSTNKDEYVAYFTNTNISGNNVGVVINNPYRSVGGSVGFLELIGSDSNFVDGRHGFVATQTSSLNPASNYFTDMIFKLRNDANGWEYNNSREIMRLQSQGRVGVMTSSPTSTFDVRGGARIGTNVPTGTMSDGSVSIGDTTVNYSPTTANYSTSGVTLLLSSLANSVIGFHDSGDRVDYIRVGSRLIDLGYDGGWGRADVGFTSGIWDRNGNVGIGMTTPTVPLQVRHPANNGTSTLVVETAQGFDYGAGIVIQNNNSVSGGANNYGRINLTFNAQTQAGNDSWNFGARSGIIFRRDYNLTGVYSNGYAIQHRLDNDQFGILKSDATPVIMMNQSGNVGVGTTTPISKLQVSINGNNPTRPTGTWAGIIENTTDSTDNNGLSVSTRYGAATSTIFEAATYWNGTTETYTPIFNVKGDKSVNIAGNLNVSSGLFYGSTGFVDSRSVATTPSSYNSSAMFYNFKTASTIGLDGSFAGLLSISPWSDDNGGGVHELGFSDLGNINYRYGTRSNGFGSWRTLWDTSSLRWNNGGLEYNNSGTWTSTFNTSNMEVLFWMGAI